MRLFATQLKGKTVMTRHGEILGALEGLMMDTRAGKVVDLLVAPAEGVEPRLFKTDARKRIVLPYATLVSARDVVVVDLERSG